MLKHVRALALTLACAVAGALPGGPAAAACGGTNFLATLERTDPGTHAAFFARAHAVAHPVGRFWRIDSPGRAPSYVFGTFHVVEATRVALTAEVLGALAEAERLVVEVDSAAAAQTVVAAAAPAAPAAPSISRTIAGASGASLSSRLGPELTAHASAILAPRGVEIGALENATPFEVLVRLEVMPCLFEGGPVMDQLVQDWARRTGLPVVGLEAPGAAMGALDGIGEENSWELVRETVRQYAEIPVEDAFQAQLALYLADEMQALLDLSRLMSEHVGSDPGHARFVGNLLTEHLMTRRNLDWLPRLTEQLERGGAFVAVGAGHLPGENGLIALIERKGFTVTRLDAGTPAPGGVEALLAGMPLRRN